MLLVKYSSIADTQPRYEVQAKSWLGVWFCVLKTNDLVHAIKVTKQLQYEQKTRCMHEEARIVDMHN